MDVETATDFDEAPNYGLKFLLNHEFSLQTKQLIIPRAKQILDMMPLSARYVKYYMEKKMHKKRPIMDYFNSISAQRIHGCPIGGIGGGTIGRGFKGEFCRFQLSPGLYEYITVPECQFIVNIRNVANETIFQSVLSTYNKPKKAPQTWEWNLNGAECEYTALYPRAWTTYDLSKYGIKLVCRQISPVIPHNYKDSSLPCAVFVFSAKNISNEHRDVSITFTWTEVLAGANKKKTISKLDLERYSEEHTCGVTLEQKVADTCCTFTIAKNRSEIETIHEGYCLWNSSKSSNYVWECLKEHGTLQPDSSQVPQPSKLFEKPNSSNKTKKKQKKIYKYDSIALSSSISLDPGGCGSTEFCLAWDMPVIKYKNDKKLHKRYYTKYFGSHGIAGPSIASYALKNYTKWEKQLAEWQDPILTNSNIPDWLKSALMNELYFVADGGTIWFDVHDEYPETDPRHDFGLFGYLEGHEYRMYNTYDVHFYASFAIAQLWPNLQVVLQYMFRDTIAVEDPLLRASLYDGKRTKFKVKNSIPHDLGDPDDVPFTNINAYNIHDISEWRDLNLKFILQVMRDYKLLKGHSAPFGIERYESMQFIDDLEDGLEDDLYMRSTGQGSSPERASERTHERTPKKSPERTPEKSPERTPKKSPERTPKKSPERLPENSPEKTPERPSKRSSDIVQLLHSGIGRSPESGGGGEKAREASAVWGARAYLADMYDACVALLRRTALFDTDADGLIENGGFPDQTYDAWVMTGPSAYCGGLWVASLSVVAAMAKILGFEEDEREFSKMLELARYSFDEKLWNGSFYRFDTKPCNHNVVMADQLAGHWFLRASGWTEPVFPAGRVRAALQAVYDNNVQGFAGGRLGAVNGCRVGGRVDISALQSEEAWTGVTYGVAALMIYEGMHEQAFATAGGMYDSLTKMGLAFETPEALYENGNHRSIAYMRPLAVWGMYQAILARPLPAPVANGHAVKTHL